ncbi:bacteriophage protein [Beggiatoa sp. PS]|nr:bacteriophage protein [Beggiatoa sp. PS]
MDVREFLTSAQQQIQENSEVGYRNAASRSYYCAFHLCRMLLEKLPQSQDNIGTSHQKIIDALFLSSDKRLKSLGNQLKMARQLRHKADYKVDTKFTRYEASRVLSYVQKIVLEVDNILQSLQQEESDKK